MDLEKSDKVGLGIFHVNAKDLERELDPPIPPLEQSKCKVYHLMVDADCVQNVSLVEHNQNIFVVTGETDCAQAHNQSVLFGCNQNIKLCGQSRYFVKRKSAVKKRTVVLRMRTECSW